MCLFEFDPSEFVNEVHFDRKLLQVEILHHDVPDETKVFKVLMPIELYFDLSHTVCKRSKKIGPIDTKTLKDLCFIW